MLRSASATPARRSGGIGIRKGAASSGVGTAGKRSKAASIRSGFRWAVAPRAQKISRPSTLAVTRTWAALRPSASTSVVHSKRSPMVVSPAMNWTVVHSAGRAVSTSASATATAMAVPPNSLPSKRARGRVSSKLARPGPSGVSPSSSWSVARDWPSMVRSAQAAVMATTVSAEAVARTRNPAAASSHPAGTLRAWLPGAGVRARCGAHGRTSRRTTATSPSS